MMDNLRTRLTFAYRYRIQNMLRRHLVPLLNRLPYVRGLYSAVRNLQTNTRFEPGHFYSTIISVKEVAQRQQELWPEHDRPLTGINLNTDAQVELVGELEAYYNELPFAEAPQDQTRYHYANNYFAHTDAILLYGIIRHFRPARIIEVGSGFSSCVMLDTDERFNNSSMSLTCIEPHPERLRKLLRPQDTNRLALLEMQVQDVPLSTFDELGKGDVLFIDSSHVVKTGSDVHHLLFEVLPRLKSGVLIHLHDIFHPFEYPKDWVLGGFNWNEDYFIRAFLMHNQAYRIKLFANYLHKVHPSVFANMPLCYRNRGGSLWLEKC